MKFTVKELRARANKTQVEMAGLLGVSTTTYNAWENNFGNVKAKYAAKMADIFGVKLDEIFFEPVLENKSSGE